MEEYFINVFTVDKDGSVCSESSHMTQESAEEEAQSGFIGLTYLHTIHSQRDAQKKWHTDCVDLSPEAAADEDYFRELAAE